MTFGFRATSQWLARNIWLRLSSGSSIAEVVSILYHDMNIVNRRFPHLVEKWQARMELTDFLKGGLTRVDEKGGKWRGREVCFSGL